MFKGLPMRNNYRPGKSRRHSTTREASHRRHPSCRPCHASSAACPRPSSSSSSSASACAALRRRFKSGHRCSRSGGDSPLPRGVDQVRVFSLLGIVMELIIASMRSNCFRVQLRLRRLRHAAHPGHLVEHRAYAPHVFHLLQAGLGSLRGRSARPSPPFFARRLRFLLVDVALSASSISDRQVAHAQDAGRQADRGKTAPAHLSSLQRP